MVDCDNSSETLHVFMNEGFETRKMISRGTVGLLVIWMLTLAQWSSAQTTSSSTDSATEPSVPPPTTGSAGNVTTYGVVSSATDCVLELPPDTIEQLPNVFIEGAVFIRFNLKMKGMKTIYENSSDVVAPFTWVWALEGKGDLLLSYPFDFQQLSLGTLSLGVVDVDVAVTLPDDGCFQQAADADKQRILAKFIGSLVQSANDTIKDLDVFTEETVICTEKQLTSDEFAVIGVYAIPLSTYYVFQGSTEYECWPGSSDPFESEPMRISKHGWLGAIFALGFILALFSPLAASFFIRHNPPIVADGEEYLAINSDLPLGLKYLLCFSFQDCSAVVAIRWFVYVVAFMLIPFIPYIVSYVIRGDAFIYRMEVAYGLLLSKSLVIFWFVVVNLIFLTIAMLFLGLYLYDDSFVPNSLIVMPADRRYFGFVFDMPPELHVPNKKTTPMRGFMYTMLHRTQMAINPDVWSFWFNDLFWKKIYGLLGKRSDDGDRNSCRFIAALLIFLIVLPFAIVSFLFFLLFNSIPLFYTIFWVIAKSLSNDVRASEVIVALMTMFLSFAVLFIFVAAFVFVAELIGYTFIGFVLNSDFAGPIVVVVITVAGYLINAATNFYDKYCILLKRLIEQAETIDKELAKTGRRQMEDEAANNSDMELKQQDSGETQTILPAVRQLVRDRNGVPTIPLRLFKLVVAKYQPMYLEVASVLLQLLVISILVGFGLATIIYIDAVSDLPATVEFFATVIVATVVPVLMLILKSPAKEENDDEARSCQLNADLEYYAHCEQGQEQFSSMAL